MTFQGCNCNLLLVTGEYSCLTVDLTFKREFSYYLLTIYVPCCMLVIVSWVNTLLLCILEKGFDIWRNKSNCQVSFWLDPNAVPARVSLGVTTLLTMSTQQVPNPPHHHHPPHTTAILLHLLLLGMDQNVGTKFQCQNVFFFLGWETSAAREELPLIWIYLQASSVWWEIPTQKSWKDFLAPSQYEPSIVFSLHFFSTFLLLP